MQEFILDSRPTGHRTNLLRCALIAALLLALPVGFVGYRARAARRLISPSTATESMPIAEFEERHGLRVQLIGVTAAGGLVDLRLKVLDDDKAREFLEDPANLPRLIAAESGERLVGAREMHDDVSWEVGTILFELVPNTGGIIKAGTPVIVEFGSVQLEAIPAQ